ncbi:hypothetical protein C8J56DRAFT_1078184 [Mycena floridula]|nr:hypothetical protein C8J56DRAFT_1078184 [Mycena floridula]
MRLSPPHPNLHLRVSSTSYTSFTTPSSWQRQHHICTSPLGPMLAATVTSSETFGSACSFKTDITIFSRLFHALGPNLKIDGLLVTESRRIFASRVDLIFPNAVHCLVLLLLKGQDDRGQGDQGETRRNSGVKVGLGGIRADRWGPRPKKPERVEPAPGTFGYDHSKYRPPRAGDEFSPVLFDEFGRPTRVAEEDNEGQEISRIRSHMTKFASEAMVGISSLLHLLFSFHITLLLRQQRPTYRESVPQKQEEEDGAGCCKCVVM